MYEYKFMQEFIKVDLREIECFCELIQDCVVDRGLFLEECLECVCVGNFIKEDLKVFYCEVFYVVMFDFIQEEFGMVRGFVVQGKKDLVCEVVCLCVLVKIIKQVMENVDLLQLNFQYVEVFCLMIYIQINVEKLDVFEVLKVWNSCDGVILFIVYIGGKMFEYYLQGMIGLLYDFLVLVMYKWVMCIEVEIMVVWWCIFDCVVVFGWFELDKVELQCDNLLVVQFWYYGIGLVSVVLGCFIDEEFDWLFGGVDEMQILE